jgi:Protein of unknown function (DUF4232)
MNELQDDVRDMLSRKAAELPPHLNVPAALPGRVRRRVVWNAVAAGAAVAVIAVALVAGVRTFGGPDASVPEGQPSPTPPSPNLPSCASSQLVAAATMEGAAGSRDGTIDVMNASGVSCTVQGTPGLTLLDQHRDPIASGVTFDRIEPLWQVDGDPQPADWPTVTLAPHRSASVRIGWTNWCADGGALPTMRLQLPDGSEADVSGLDELGPPPCNGPGSPSTIELGPFEPSSPS